MPSNPHTEMWCICINLYLKIKCTYVQYTGLASPFLHWHSCLPCACRIINTRESGILIRLQMLFSYTCSYNCVYWISFFRNLLGFYGFFLLMFNFFLFNTCTETISYSCMSCYFNNEEFIYYSSLKVLFYCFINWCYVFKKKNYWNLRINYITKDTLMSMLLTYMKFSYVPINISQSW